MGLRGRRRGTGSSPPRTAPASPSSGREESRPWRSLIGMRVGRSARPPPVCRGLVGRVFPAAGAAPNSLRTTKNSLPFPRPGRIRPGEAEYSSGWRFLEGVTPLQGARRSAPSVLAAQFSRACRLMVTRPWRARARPAPRSNPRHAARRGGRRRRRRAGRPWRSCTPKHGKASAMPAQPRRSASVDDVSVSCCFPCGRVAAAAKRGNAW